MRTHLLPVVASLFLLGLAAKPAARGQVTTNPLPAPGKGYTTPDYDAAAVTLALVGGTLVDGFGGSPLQNSVVLVAGERIVGVGREGELIVPTQARVVDTDGMTVLPGMWDMHVHLMINGHADYKHWDTAYVDRLAEVIMPASAHQLLRAGITSARDLGGPLEASLAVRDRINAGELPGPTMYMSGPFIQHEPYPGTEAFRWGVEGAADARAKVRRLAERPDPFGRRKTAILLLSRAGLVG